MHGLTQYVGINSISQAQQHAKPEILCFKICISLQMTYCTNIEYSDRYGQSPNECSA